MVIQVLDARDPLGSRCPQVEEAVLETGSKKKLVLLLNKIGTVLSCIFLNLSGLAKEAGNYSFIRMNSNTMSSLIIFVLSSDLVPKENVEKWLKYLRNEFPTVAFKASTQTQRENLVNQFLFCLLNWLIDTYMKILGLI